ncbi:MAG TPA: AsmA family protein, partial [Terriglobales bacterium]|nr:AsmA family protein [Terriglobales bacterium]
MATAQAPQTPGHQESLHEQAEIEQSGPSPRRKRRLFYLALLILLVLALAPPLFTLNSFRNRLESAMSAAVSRKVTVKNVHLRLLPAPGFNLEGFEIQDDPAFSPEPLLRADEVSATLRLSSLWRGKVEVATLSLQEPSLNLVRGADGHWNLESLLTHATQVPVAPTAKARAEVRPRFPYIECSNGRINFKIGDEKKVYVLVDADFALWLASEDKWETRLKARPVRTDADLGDTGTLKISGSFERAASLRETPLHLNLSLERAQLGQLTHLIYGRDRGWRGRIDAEGTLSGSPAVLNGAGKISVADFRRYDIGTSDSFNAEIRCDGVLASTNQNGANAFPVGTRILRGSCTWPGDTGIINATGYYLPGLRSGSVQMMAASFPLSTLVTLAKHMKRGIADDLTAEGALNGRITLHRGAVPSEPGAMVQDGREHWTLTANPVLRSNAFPQPIEAGIWVLNFEEPAAGAALMQGFKAQRASAP